MNLRNIVRRAINAVNPDTPIIIQVSTGYATGLDGSRAPSYAPPITVMGQIQALRLKDIQKLDGLNLQGEKRKIFINGRIDGIMRPKNKGGDLVTLPDGTIWLVACVLEYWADWVCVVVVLQNK